MCFTGEIQRLTSQLAHLESSSLDDRIERIPDRLRGLAGVPGQLGGDALAPADRTVALDPREDVGLMGLPGPARLIRLFERQPDGEKLDAFDVVRHRLPSIGPSRYAPARWLPTTSIS